MRTMLSFCALSLALGCTAALAAEIDPQLVRTLATISPDQKLPVDFYLKAQANAIDLDPGIADLPRPQRRARVGRVLMDFAQESQRDLMAYLKAKGAEGKVEDINPHWIVNSVGCWATREVVLEVAARSDVELVYYDRMPCELGELEPGAAPVDSIPQNLLELHVRGAWNQGYHGEGVVLGVIDTGVRYTHMDLRNHLWMSDAYPNHGFNFASYQYSSGHPGPSTYDSLTPLDYYGHGTHCAGIATADGTYGQGVHETLGVAPAARIMSLPVDVYLHTPYPDTSMENNTMAAMQFCVRPPRDTLNGADVVTMSLGLIASWQPRLTAWRMAEENMRTAGLTKACAAGNESQGGVRCPGSCPPPWRNPANHPTGSGHERDTGTTATITVGGSEEGTGPVGPTTIWGSVPPWYDYEYPPGLVDPDVVAPSVNLVSTYYSSDSAYTTMSGTSMSTPQVAGAVCLMLPKGPLLTPGEIDSILELYGVHDLGEPGKDNWYGAGIIDCSLAVAFTPCLNYDIAVLRILPPSETIPVGTVISPSCTLFNYGSTTVVYGVRYRIGHLPPFDVMVFHPPGTYQCATFAQWSLDTGVYVQVCSVDVHDQNPTNDWKMDTIWVAPSGSIGEADANQPDRPMLAIAPNPCRGVLAVRLPLSADRLLEFKVYDAKGRLVRQLALRARARAQVDLHDLPDGVYLVRIESGNKGSEMKRVVLVR